MKFHYDSMNGGVFFKSGKFIPVETKTEAIRFLKSRLQARELTHGEFVMLSAEVEGFKDFPM